MKNLNLDFELRSLQLQTERVLNELTEVHELLGGISPQKNKENITPWTNVRK